MSVINMLYTLLTGCDRVLESVPSLHMPYMLGIISRKLSFVISPHYCICICILVLFLSERLTPPEENPYL